MTVNYDSGLYGYNQATVTFDGTDTSPPKSRFILDASTLNDFGIGLDGSSPAFTLDTSTLDGLGKLDGYTFLTTATGAASLGGMSAIVSATVTEFAVLSAPLGGLDANASATVTEFAVASADLGGLVATANATVIPPTPTPEPIPSGGRQYAAPRRKKIEPLPEIEIPVIQPKRRYAVCSATLGGMTAQAEAMITFSILDDDAEVLLLV